MKKICKTQVGFNKQVCLNKGDVKQLIHIYQLIFNGKIY